MLAVSRSALQRPHRRGPDVLSCVGWVFARAAIGRPVVREALARLPACSGRSCGFLRRRFGAAGAPPTSPSAPTVTSVVVTGWTRPLAVGERIALSATAIYSDGSPRNVTHEATWESSNANVATVSDGMVTAVAEGATAIIARFADKDGNQGVTVDRTAIPVPVPGPPIPPLPPSPSPPPGLACGTERWFVKTLADADAPKVNLGAVTPISIRDLNGFATHCSGLPESRTFAEEYKVFEAVGRITYVAHEDDRDYHVAIEDPNAPGYTVVTELADVRDCSRASRTDRAPSALVGTTVRVRGVGFYDFAHGQRGRSRNCIELHPILSIARY